MNILLVDDEQSSRVWLARFLSKIGHSVVEKEDGISALQAFDQGNFQAVLTDNRMPGMSGLDLLRQIKSRERGADTDVVIFTAFGDMDNTIAALRAGAYDYILKPVDIEELVSLIDRVAEHQNLKLRNSLLTKQLEGASGAAVRVRRSAPIEQTYIRLAGQGKIGIFSLAMKKVFMQAERLHSDRSLPVLIEGETGTGKEMVARYIHYGPEEVSEPFVGLNCAALAPTIFESELFGYEAGAFTGGLPRGQVGKLDMARGGTLFLDEITEMPVEMQAKLLRVIQEKEFYRVGGLKPIKTDVRIICATNVDIEERVAEGRFRRDLYYRLNVGRIHVPPLRQRKEDILPLANMFLQELSEEKKENLREIAPEAAKMLQSHSWPGNVRELKNVIEWAALMGNDPVIKPAHLGMLEGFPLPKPAPDELHPLVIDPQHFELPPDHLPLEEFNRRIIEKALDMHGGNKTETARYLGISRSSLYCRLKYKK